MVSQNLVDNATCRRSAAGQRTKVPVPVEPIIFKLTPELEHLRTTHVTPSQIAATPGLERKRALTKLRLKELKVGRVEVQLERELHEME